jgi:NADPH-dependent curcumin reductase CurA
LTTRSFVLRRRPAGRPSADLFELVEGPMPALGERQFIVRVLLIGTDVGPVSRLREEPNYAPRIELGEVMPSNGVGQVVASRHPDVEPGRLLSGPFGWREHAVRDEIAGCFDVNPAGPPSAALGLLGLHGLTAYVGFLDIAEPRAGETVVVSAAGGATGLIVGQLAKIHGCRAVGIAGGRDKARRVVEEFGFDACVDYRAPGLQDALGQACPGGVDIYFDTVGGEIQDAVVPLLNPFGRFVVCGRIALANLSGPRLDVGPRDHNAVLVNRLRKQGFLVYDHLDRRAAAHEDLWRWHEDGRLTLPESIVEGFERLPQAFIGMLDGDNLGRRLVHVADPVASHAGAA